MVLLVVCFVLLNGNIQAYFMFLSYCLQFEDWQHTFSACPTISIDRISSDVSHQQRHHILLIVVPYKHSVNNVQNIYINVSDRQINTDNVCLSYIIYYLHISVNIATTIMAPSNNTGKIHQTTKQHKQNHFMV